MAAPAHLHRLFQRAGAVQEEPSGIWNCLFSWCFFQRASFSHSPSTGLAEEEEAGRISGVGLVSACLESQLLPKAPGCGVEVK